MTKKCWKLAGGPGFNVNNARCRPARLLGKMVAGWVFVICEVCFGGRDLVFGNEEEKVLESLESSG